MKFEAFLREHGIRPKRPPLPDGKVHRCGTDTHPRSTNGAYHLSIEGDFGWAQDWAVHSEPIHWHPEDESTDVPTYDPARMERARKAARERRAQQQNATRAARAYYENATPLRGGHPYLDDHNLDMTGCYGLKVDADGWLIVPAQRANKIMTLQRISPDGQKLFWKDAPAKAATYMIRRKNAPVTVLCEGLATGLALYACLPQASILVAFNTGNMTEDDVHTRLGRGMVSVAADNDHGTVCPMHREEGLERAPDPREGLPKGCRCNPGVTKALEAATALGCGVAVPEGIVGTDWADARAEWTEYELERKRENTPESQVRRMVDGRIKMAVMRHAKMRRAT